MNGSWEQYLNQSAKQDEREILTDDCIRKDLLDRIKMTGVHLLAYLPLLALWILLMILAPGLIFLYLIVNIFLACVLVLYIIHFVQAISGFAYARKEIRVVTDIKVGEKIVYAWWANIEAMLRKWCYLYFKRYGKYHLPLTSYKWSDNFRMNHYDLMENSYDREEFYLVVDKKERILYAYPYKCFRYQIDEQ